MLNSKDGMSDQYSPVGAACSSPGRKAWVCEKCGLDEKTFRLMLNDNAMATDKLAEGIRLFNNDIIKLEQFIAEKHR